jgi:hypothetical protein
MIFSRVDSAWQSVLSSKQSRSSEQGGMQGMHRSVDREVVLGSFALAVLGILMTAGRYLRGRG